VILDLLDDCARVIREFYPVISVACLQLYHYIIPFLPLKSHLSQMYGSKLQPHIYVKEGQEQSWSPCIRVLKGHTGPCHSVAFSPSGGQLASISNDCTIWLWNIATGALLQVIEGHTLPVTSVAYSPDETLIVSGSDDKAIRIWDSATALQVSDWEYTGHLGPVGLISFSGDSQLIASSTSDDQHVHVWSVDATCRSVKVISAHGSPRSLRFMHPNRLVIMTTSSITIWDHRIRLLHQADQPSKRSCSTWHGTG
jgi:WD40 repeat protein